MKINNVLSTVEKIGDGTSVKGGLSVEDMGKIWDMLQDPYKDPIGAIVREIVSNGVDSHTEAGCNDTPVVVRIEYNEDTNQYTWSSEDFGVGMSPERIEKTFMQYGKSTKDKSNDAIGGFGIGGKSPLSYQSTCSYLTKYNGIEYLYILRKGESGPEMDLMYETPTTEPNGTKVSVSIKNYEDAKKFLLSSMNQTLYFENIYYQIHESITVNGITGDMLNDSKIIEGDHFRVCQLQTENGPRMSHYGVLHICLGRVAYPISFQNLPSEISDVLHRFPAVALKFDVGELDVIPTREDLKYTNKTIEAIKIKLGLLAKEINDKFCKTVYLDDINEYFDLKESRNIVIGGLSYSISIEGIKPSYSLKGLEDYEGQIIRSRISRGELLATPLRLRNKYNKTNGRAINTYDSLSNMIYKIISGDRYYTAPLYIGSSDIVPKKNRYIISISNYSDTRGNNGFYLVEKRAKLPLSVLKELLHLTSMNRPYWRKIINAYLTAVEHTLRKHLLDYDSLVVPDTFEPKTAKTINRVSVGAQEVYVNVITKDSSSQSGLRSSSQVRSLDSLSSMFLVVYEEKKAISQSSFEMLLSQYSNQVRRVMFIQATPTDIKKYFEKYNYGMSYESFIRGESDKAKSVMRDVLQTYFSAKLSDTTLLDVANDLHIPEAKDLYDTFKLTHYPKHLRYDERQFIDQIAPYLISQGVLSDEYLTKYNRAMFLAYKHPIFILKTHHSIDRKVMAVLINNGLPKELKLKLGAECYTAYKKYRDELKDESSITPLTNFIEIYLTVKKDGNYVKDRFKRQEHQEEVVLKDSDNSKVLGLI